MNTVSTNINRSSIYNNLLLQKFIHRTESTSATKWDPLCFHCDKGVRPHIYIVRCCCTATHIPTSAAKESTTKTHDLMISIIILKAIFPFVLRVFHSNACAIFRATKAALIIHIALKTSFRIQESRRL
jgi:hypothetical protein